MSTAPRRLPAALAFHDNLGMRLRGAYLTMHRRTNAHFARFGMTSDQFVILSLLDEEDGITQQELVRRSYSDPNTITAMLRLLEQRGMVQRTPHPEDGRARCVRLTPEGRAMAETLLHSLDEFHKELEATLPAEAGEAIHHWLQQMIDTMSGPRRR